MVHSWQQIARAIGAAADLEEALALAVHEVRAALPVDACEIYLADANSRFAVRWSRCATRRRRRAQAHRREFAAALPGAFWACRSSTITVCSVSSPPGRA